MSRFAKVLSVVLFVTCFPRLSHAANLTLAWDVPDDGVATGYIILYGTAPRSYSRQLNVGNTTTYTLTGLFVGTTYYFAVKAYDATGLTSDPSEEVSATIATIIPPVVTALALTANVPPPQVAGTSVTWLATAIGGVAPYQFQWALYGAGKWTVSPWTTASTWTWKPSTAGSDYQVKVAVRSAGSTSTAGEMVQSVPFTVTAPSVAVTLTPNVAAPQTVGSTIRWSAVASGGTAGYEYVWGVFNGSVWTPMTSWTTSSTWYWTPKVPDSRYIVAVWVRRVGSLTGVAEAFAFVPFSITSAPTAPCGDSCK